jgi:hypothetical protein
MKKLPFLVKPSDDWRGTIGARLSKADLMVYVAAITAEDMEFKPKAIVIHNTAAPNMAQWKASPVYPNRMNGLTGWYRDKQKPRWKAGPHMFVDDEGFWLFTPLWKQGTHSPSFNSSAWGIEMVGDYDKEPFDRGPGAVVRDNAVFATAVLLSRLGLKVTNKSIIFHKEDPKTTHACPGKNVSKEDFLTRCGEAMRELKSDG